MGRVKIVRRRFDRRVKKKCPQCEKEIPVACKTCPICRHQYTNSKPKSPQPEEEVLPTKRRRTKRTQRERPDFFNSLELDKQFKKKRRRKESTASVTSPNTPSSKTDGDAAAKKRRGRPKSLSQNDGEKEVGPPPDEDMFASLPPEKFLQYTIILAEINRKMSTQNFKPS